MTPPTMAAPPPEDPVVAPVPNMTGTMATTLPAGVPLKDSSVAHVPSASENEQRASKKGKMRPGPSLTARYAILTHIISSSRRVALIHLFLEISVR
jgi:hypothetical protein